MESAELTEKSDSSGHAGMAQLIMSKYTFITLVDTEEILVYDSKKGYYTYFGEAVIKRTVHNVLLEHDLASKSKRSFINEVIAFIQRSTFVNRDKINSAMYLLNIGNGILDVRTYKLHAHNPKLLSTIRIPVNYEQAAKCPNIMKFFREIVGEENVQLLIELFAWCLDVNSPIQRFVILVGEGSNGKSTFINLLRAFMGSANCSSVTLQSLSYNRFASSELFGKLVNIYPDLPTYLIKDTGPLKALTGGDAINAERKFERGFTFVNKAKLIFSANKPPEIEDESYAIWRRMVIIEFPNKFILGVNRDPELIEKLTAPEELSGLLNLAIEKIKILREQGDFSYHADWKAIRSKYTLLSDPVSEFIDIACNFDPLVEIPKPNLYKAYCEFCKKKGVPAQTSRGFGRVINRKYSRAIYSRANDWAGIRLKKDWKERL